MANLISFVGKPKDIYIHQGNSVEYVILIADGLDPLDLTNTTMTIEIKKFYNTVSIYTNIVTSQGDPTLGYIKLSIPNTVTATMNAERYVYRIIAVSDDISKTILDGHLFVSRF